MAPPIARLEPSFILAGVPRAGTTALWDALVQNDPNIVAPTTKELNYFNSIGWETKPPRWYLSQFPRRTPSRNRLTGDGSCTSCLCPAAASRAAQRAPTIKRAIFMVRDEVDRVRSHYLMCVRNERAQRPAKQAVTLPPLAALLEAELRRISRCDATVPPLERFATCYVNASATCRFSSAVLPSTLRKGNRPGCFHLIAASLYALAIAPWMKSLGAANVLVVRKDDLQREPRRTLQNVSAFLGSSHAYPARLRRPPPRPTPRRREGRDVALPPELAERLEAFFAPHREGFRTLVGRERIATTS